MILIDYLYYTLHLFYTRIIKIQKYDTPHWNCSAVIGLLSSFYVFGIIKLYIYNTYSLEEEQPTVRPIIMFSIWVILFAMTWYYYKEKREDIISILDKRNKKQKIFIVLLSVVLIVFSIFVFFYTGTL